MIVRLSHRHHVVSAVLLRRWTDGHGKLTAVDKRGRVRTRPAKREGFADNFLVDDYDRHEPAWQSIENAANAAFAAVDAGSALSRPEMLKVLRQLVALHWARSYQMIAVHERTTRANLHKHRSGLTEPELDAAFTALTGLEPAGPGARSYVAARIDEVVRAEIQTGAAFFAERVDANLTQFETLLSSWSVEVREPADGHQFVIGDCPVQTIHHSGRSGVLNGVNTDVADEIVFPLGPRHLLAFSRDRGGTTTVDGAEVDRLNRVQADNVKYKVYLQPGSGLDKFVRAHFGVL